jgi:hypothetical protein
MLTVILVTFGINKLNFDNSSTYYLPLLNEYGYCIHSDLPFNDDKLYIVGWL